MKPRFLVNINNFDRSETVKKKTEKIFQNHAEGFKNLQHDFEKTSAWFAKTFCMIFLIISRHSQTVIYQPFTHTENKAEKHEASS